jgi:hypothetical protein
MKKIYLLSFSIAFVALTFAFTPLKAQNMVVNGDLEQWTAGVPNNWDHVENITQESTIVHDGLYSARHQSASGTQDFGHEYITGITEGASYTLSYYYYDNDPNAKTRVWSKFMDAGGATVGTTIESDYSTDSPNWVLYTNDVIAPAGATQFYLEVRVYKEAAEGGYVYYDDFNFVGDQTVYPEPTNYPTSFGSEVTALSINLNWVDAVGGQLPRAYLVKGVKDGTAVVPPVDGVVEPDDTDWTDGAAALNVDFGVENVVFDNLAGDQTYTFYIYPYTNAAANIDYKTDGTAPETSATTENATIISYENFASGLGVWTPYSVIGDQEWFQDEFGGVTFAKVSGYQGQPYANEDWLISPMLNLSLYEDVLFSFTTAANYTGPDLELYYSNDYDGSGDPTDFTWNSITDEAAWSAGSWVWTPSGDIELDAYGSASFYLGFRFTSTETESATWELTECRVMGILKTDILQNKTIELQVYPNPATDFVQVVSNENATMEIVNLMGQKVLSQSVMTGSNTVSVNELKSGVYFVRVAYADGITAINKIIVR